MADNDTTDTYEHWTGPVRSIIRRGRKVPLLPPRPGETEPAAWTMDPDILEAMDVDGRPVESATVQARDGRGELVVKFKDGTETVYDYGLVRGTPCPS